MVREDHIVEAIHQLDGRHPYTPHAQDTSSLRVGSQYVALSHSWERLGQYVKGKELSIGRQ